MKKALLFCFFIFLIVVQSFAQSPPPVTIEAYDALGNPLGINPTVCQFQSIDFYVQGPYESTEPKTFKWKKNGIVQIVQTGINPLPPAVIWNSSTLVSGDIITLTVVFTAPPPFYSPDSVTSQNMTFTVIPNQPPTVIVSHNFPSDSICQGNMVTFTAITLEAGTPSYQWYLDGMPVGSAPTYSTSPTLLPGSHSFWCQITSNEPCDVVDPVYNPVAISNSINIYINPCTYLMPASGNLGPYFICGPFLDSPVNYNNNMNGLIKFCPVVANQFDTLSFSSLALNDAGDRLRIFSGSPASSFTADTSSIPLINIAGATNVVNGPVVISNTLGGCLTVHFRTDAAGTAAGWVADIACPASSSAVWTTIEGDLYIDANSNCIKDNGEAAVAGIPLRLYQGNTIRSTTYSSFSGHYTFYAYDSVYSVALSPQIANYGVSADCPLTGHLNILSMPSTGNDFGLQCVTGYDLIAAVNSSAFRPGFTSHIYPSVQNFYCPNVSGQAKLIVSNPDVTFLSATILPDAIIGDTLVWNFSFFNSYHNLGTIDFHTSPSASIGDTVTIKFMVEPDSGDALPTNNTIIYHRIITNSSDPNDKTVTPADPVSPDSWLTYTIRFQNTGTDTAFNVYVVDTLDFNLNLYTFQPLAASHPYHIIMLDSNVVKFIFNNIMLPDSNVNEPLSHGYITYRVKSLAGLPDATVINNTAHIYFDFNPAVVTNTTATVIDIPTSVGEQHFASETLTLVPNPATGEFTIYGLRFTISNIEIFNLLGEKVFSQPVTSNPKQVTINVSTFPQGIYFVKVKGEKEERAAKFVKQ